MVDALTAVIFERRSAADCPILVKFGIYTYIKRIYIAPQTTTTTYLIIN